MEIQDEMMAMWKEMDVKLTSLVEENKKLAEQIKKDKLRSNQDKLIRKYRLFIIIEIVFIPLIILYLGFNPLVIPQYRLVTMIYFVCFFLFEIIVDSYLLYKLTRIDIYNDSFIEIKHRALTNWKTHKIAIIAGLPIAVGAVILFALALGADTVMLTGIIIGAVIGVAIGLNEFFKFLKYYKAMVRE